MVARRLQWELTLEIGALWLTFYITGMSSLAALLASAAALLVLYGLLTLLTFVLAGLSPFAKQSWNLGFAAALRTFILEWLSFFALFALIQPFEALFSREESPENQPGGERLILLVHGYLCNRGLWSWISARLRREGLRAAAVNLEPPLAGIDQLAESLHRQIDALSGEAGVREIVLVTHSMGGLVARACLKRYGQGAVVKLITLGCPHHGTRLAHFGFGRSAREMETGSQWLQKLAEGERESVPVLSVWSRHDNFVAPQVSGYLSKGEDVQIEAMGHLSMVFSRHVLAILKRELVRRQAT
jgi:triacylglycerol lipase